MVSFITQSLLFDDINWASKENNKPTPANNMVGIKNITSPPLIRCSGMTKWGNDNLLPYWIYRYEVTSQGGIQLQDINVKDTIEIGSSEPVFERVNFTDFEVSFTDKTVVFDIASAIQEPLSTFEFQENGELRSDFLFQRGMKLILFQNVLAGEGSCWIKLEIAIVFRGANNDFDPGGIPVALKMYPQFAFTWLPDGPDSKSKCTETPIKFTGRVRLNCNNRMPPMYHAKHGHTHPATSGNIASFFSDSKVLPNQNKRLVFVNDVVDWLGGSILNAPTGWTLLFDYANLNLKKENKITGTVALGEQAYERRYRKRKYIYLKDYKPFTSGDSFGVPIEVCKSPRQKQYDNIHIHAKMSSLDLCGNEQVHAPFCGHSCIHLHWRWSNISVMGAKTRGRVFKGWSNPNPPANINSLDTKSYVKYLPFSNSTPDAPLVPPNQKISVALSNPSTIQFNNINENNDLSDSNKVLWYNVEIFNPKKNHKQVAFEHGIGWSYRYSNPNESDTLKSLISAYLDDDLQDDANSSDVQDFFMNMVYTNMSYFKKLYNANNNPISCLIQIPDGSFKGTNAISMEDL